MSVGVSLDALLSPLLSYDPPHRFPRLPSDCIFLTPLPDFRSVAILCGDRARWSQCLVLEELTEWSTSVPWFCPSGGEMSYAFWLLGSRRPRGGRILLFARGD